MRFPLLRARVERRLTMAKATNHSFKVGDILASSWGYEQTNVCLYQVVELNGATMVTVKPVHLPVNRIDAISGMSEDISFRLPMPGTIVASDTAKPIKRKVKNYYKDKRPEGDLIEIASYENAYRYNGEKMYRSWYA